MKQRNQALATKRLVAKALKDKPKWKPAKGYKYLKDLKEGSLFVTEGGLRGVLIECSTNARVIITECSSGELGKKIIAAETEVKEIT
jgi:preprotein translocase subunit YajC